MIEAKSNLETMSPGELMVYIDECSARGLTDEKKRAQDILEKKRSNLEGEPKKMTRQDKIMAFVFLVGSTVSGYIMFKSGLMDDLLFGSFPEDLDWRLQGFRVAMYFIPISFLGLKLWHVYRFIKNRKKQ